MGEEPMWGAIGRGIAWGIAGLIAGMIGTSGVLLGATALIDAQVPVRIASGGTIFTGSWDRGYASAQGTWTIEGHRSAFPIQFTRVSCFKSDNQCTVAQAEIAFGDFLTVHLDFMGIRTWNNETVVFADSSPLCFDYVYTISRTNERAFGTRIPKNKETPTCKAIFEPRELKLTLTDGFEVSKKLKADASGRIMPFAWIVVGLWWSVVLIFVVYRIRRPRAVIRSGEAPAHLILLALAALAVPSVADAQGVMCQNWLRPAAFRVGEPASTSPEHAPARDSRSP